jgi:hypothetical protein
MPRIRAKTKQVSSIFTAYKQTRSLIPFFMTNDQIEKFLTSNLEDANSTVKIAFKTRNPLEGIFIRTSDYDELKSKNFWRIVTGPNIDSYKRSKDSSLARMFNGMEFTKLSAK